MEGQCDLPALSSLNNNAGRGWSYMRKYSTRTGLPKENPIEYYTYRSMLSRCYNPNNASAEYYYGDNIRVSDSWLGPEGFKNFLRDMGKRPGPGYSLDRIDGKLGYSSENCKWSTWIEQAGNRRGNNDVVGVSRHKASGGWLAYISIDGKRLMKCFRTKEEAIAQRKKMGEMTRT